MTYESELKALIVAFRQSKQREPLSDELFELQAAAADATGAKLMTYAQLYRLATGWTARHVAQDLMIMFDKDTLVSKRDLATVNEWMRKDGEPEIPAPSIVRYE